MHGIKNNIRGSFMEKKKEKKKSYRFVQHSSRPISVEFKELPGKRISTGTRDIIEAVQFAENFIHSGQLEKLVTKSENIIPTLSEYGKNFFLRTDRNSYRFYNTRHNKIISDHGYKQRQDLFDLYICKRFGNLRLDEIRSIDIDRWLTTIKGILVKDLSDNTRNKILCSFRIILDFAVYQGLISENPAKGVKEISERIKWERRALTKEEQEKLFPRSAKKRIEIWGTLMWAVYFSISYDTGFRPGEIAGLSLSNFYKTSGGLAISTTQSISCVTKDVQPRVKTTGHGMNERVGLLDDITAELLFKYLEENKTEIIKQGDTGPILLTDRKISKHKYIDVATSNKHFKTVLKRNNIPVCTQYCLRHTYMTERRGNLTDRILALAMGHAKLRDDYDHQNAEKLISQLEENRSALFRKDKKENDIISLKDLF